MPRVCATGLLVVVLVFTVGSVAWAQRLVVDNFDDGSLPTLLGTDYGVWNRYPDDPTQGCRDSLVASEAIKNTGLALRLEYDVDSPHPAYCGFWAKLPALDLRPYQLLVMFLRGDAAAGYTTQITIELKNEPVAAEGDSAGSLLTPHTGRYRLEGVTAEWQPFVIPLDAMEGLGDRSRVIELVILLDDMTATSKTGALYLDDLAFE